MPFSVSAAPSRAAPRALAIWLLVVAAMVFAIVVVGGITRLTESGLSIVEWDPILGTVPPLTHAQWQAAFDGYKAIPQYHAFNQGMTLDGFRHIFFWEYLHRLLARMIGTVLGLVLLVFWWRRRIPAGYGWRVLLILALGGLQGVIGWWMVASGLQFRTEVSHIRLAVHLSAAMLIYAVLIWTALDLLALDRRGTDARARLRPWPALALLMLAGQIVLGAFTAGLRAGYAFASWPLMGERLFPDGGWLDGKGLVANLVSNPIVVQFVHRWWAWAVAVAAVLLALAARRAGERRAPVVLVALVALQILLGILTLLSGVRIEVAVAHQAVAALLLGAMVWTAHGLGRSRAVR
ncbi:COX15/CtaA family protein [Sphingomonas nostoxanthinifaciens]|uniref:COX15/CtaA family protein n=1 Tax=Sphingomonas nostoxanthinifaciens TaxID=2872652 RepID=UPI001CC1D80E|nr:COX15/CtaA family protein [Sphingomonas nostoxanthinifaciens]UAK23604.1 COX15/CtaA family protein [Sphingomonas nostoxanthinifaciens]